MNQTIEKKPKIPVIIIYSFVFYGIWALWEFFGRSAVGSVVSDEFLLKILTEGIVKVSVWVLPAVCLVRYFRDEAYIGLKDMFTNLTEEMVFRGWLLNVTVSENRKWLPIMINAVMFLLIHFPIWIASGVFIDSFTSLNFLCVPALSIIFSWTFIKSKSIWIPITLHMYWDLLVFLFS